jgi:glyoxylase-like metal-dependent hydrolase (beta-lactamase superfamily II)
MTETSSPWQILGLRYARTQARTRANSFIMTHRPDDPHPMDFFFWVLRRGDEVIVVDTGMDGDEGNHRGRPIEHEPSAMLVALGIDPATVKTVVLTHLHFDHAGCLSTFPNATFHVQAAELAFATGAMMANPTLAMPYTADHVALMVRLVHSGRVVVHDGPCPIAQGVDGHLVGGHAAGLMALTVETARGRLVLASDVAHYYESVLKRPIFQIVVDPCSMVRGYDWLWRASDRDMARILPAHDPMVAEVYPEHAPDIFDLSAPPRPALKAMMETR